MGETIGEGVIMDCIIRKSGTLYLFYPQTDLAKEWIEENVDPEAQYFGDALVVEHRYAWNLAQGMMVDGLDIE